MYKMSQESQKDVKIMEKYINTITLGDCIEVLKLLPSDSVGSIVCDPPAGISMMQMSWDTFDHDMFGIKGQEGENDLKVKKNFNILPRYANADLIGFQNFICEVFTEAIRVLKPGGYALVWAIPRTAHHSMMGVERAGFEIRDVITHIFGSGFPKSVNIGKKLEKFQGYGTALKPATEFWILARKPISEDTIADNVLKHGTGGINIGDSRISYQSEKDKESARFGTQTDIRGNAYNKNRPSEGKVLAKDVLSSEQGRYPANLILTCICSEVIIDNKPLKVIPPTEIKGGIFSPSQGKPAGPTYKGGNVIHTNPDCPCYQLDQQSGVLKSGDNCIRRQESFFVKHGGLGKPGDVQTTHGDIGGASRFFYQAKTAMNEKWFYCKICQDVYPSNEKDNHKHEKEGKTKSYTKNRRCKICGHQEVSGSPCKCEVPDWEIIERPVAEHIVFHPTQKSESLMVYLVRLITPPNEIVLDPFAGSGTTAVAAERLGYKWICIDKDEIYCKIAQRRLNEFNKQLRLL